MENFRMKKPEVKGTTPLLQGARPTCEAHFYRWAKAKAEVVELNANSAFKGTFKNNSKERPVMVVNNDIVRATVQKDKASHAGNFTLVLKASKIGKDSDTFSKKEEIDYCAAVNPGDWVIIYMSKTSGTRVDKSNIKMLGIVERVQLEELDNAQTGTPSQVYVITGKDFGKVFETQLFFNPIMDSKTNQTLFGGEFLSDSSKVLSSSVVKTPDQIMKAIVSFFYGGAFAEANREHELWYIPPSLAAYFGVNIQTKSKPSFIDIFDYKTLVGLHGGGGTVKASLPGEMLAKSFPTSGSIWSVMSFFSNAAINELFCDLEFVNNSIRPSLIFRQLPYSVASGNLKIDTVVPETDRTFLHSLRRTTINSSILKRKAIAKADAERINHIVVIPRIEAVEPRLYKSTINPISVQQYGLRSHVVEVSYAQTKAESFEKYCAKCVSLLTEWFFNSEDYYSGVLSVEGLDTHVPVGTNIVLDDIGQLFHVEGYTHNYEQNPGGTISFTTDFSVIRGCSVNQTMLNRIETVQSTTVVKSILENIPKRVQDGRG